MWTDMPLPLYRNAAVNHSFHSPMKIWTFATGFSLVGDSALPAMPT
jgi:hypothetical protein